MEASAVLAPLQVLQLRWKGFHPPRVTLPSSTSRIFHLSDRHIYYKTGHTNEPLEFLVLLFHAFPIVLLFSSLKPKPCGYFFLSGLYYWGVKDGECCLHQLLYKGVIYGVRLHNEMNSIFRALQFLYEFVFL